MHHAFVSYSRRDSHWVAAFVAELEALGVPTWVDQRNITVTLPWLEEIRDAVVEASAVVACVSPAWGVSPACAAEVAVAEEIEVPVVRVDVRSEPPVAAREAAADLRALPASNRALTELRTLARQWARSGRPTGQLIGAGRRRSLERAAASRPQGDPVENAFLRASRSRSRRRLARASAAAVVAVVAVVAAWLVVATRSYLDDVNEDAVEAFADTGGAVEAGRSSPYEALERVAGFGSDESGVRADALTAVLRTGVPDDAVEVPVTAFFAAETVGDPVLVVDAAGVVSEHAPAGGGPVTPPVGTPPPVAPAPGWTLEVQGGSGAVAVRRDGTLHRRLLAAAPPNDAALSPDRRWIAVAVGDGVEVHDLARGVSRMQLGGAPATVTDVAWSQDGRSVWGIAGGRAVRWLLHDRRTLVDEPGRRFVGLGRSAAPGEVWVTDREGLHRRISVLDGAELQRIAIPDVVRVGSAEQGTGWHAMTGDRGLWLVDLRQGRPVLVELPRCDAFTPSVDEARGVALVPCADPDGGGELLVVGLESGEIRRRVAIPGGHPATSVGLAPGGSRWFVGTGDGRTLAVPVGAGTADPIDSSQCATVVRAVAVGPDERSILPLGDAMSQLGCHRIGIDGPAAYRWNAVLVGGTVGLDARVGEFVDDGAGVAVGFADGDLVVMPTRNLLPAVTLHLAGGRLTGLLWLEDRRELVAVTADGLVLVVPLPDGAPSNRRLAQEAGRRLERARDLGLAPR